MSRTTPRIALGFHRKRSTAPLFLPLAAFCLYGLPASAALIVVNTTVDVSSNDNVCSLREAVTAANTNSSYQGCLGGDALPLVDVIELPAGTYRLTRAPMGDDDNVSGDLDIRESLIIRGAGPDFHWWDNPSTPAIEDLSVFDAPLDWDDVLDANRRPPTVLEAGFGGTPVGDGERVLHVSPGALGPVELTLENLVIRGGDPGCTQPDCFVGGAGIWHEGPGALRVHRSVIEDNTVSCTGSQCGRARNPSPSVDQPFGAAAIAATSGASVELDASALVDNEASCSGTLCKTGHILFLGTPGFEANGPRPTLDWSRSIFARNRVSCSDPDCDAESVIHTDVVGHSATTSVFWRNSLTCEVRDCEVHDLFAQTYFAAAPTEPVKDSWFDIEFSGNWVRCVGALTDTCYAGQVLGSNSINRTFFDMADARIADNEVTCRGDGCYQTGIFHERAAVVALKGLHFTDNVSQCAGDDCETGPIAWVAETDYSSSRMDSIHLAGNDVACQGYGCYAEEVLITGLLLSDVQMVDNTGYCDGDFCSVEGIASFAGRELRDGRFVDNTLTCLGAGCDLPVSGVDLGVLRIHRSTRLIGSEITGNTAQPRGAGVATRRPMFIQLIDTVITGNQAGGGAGGVHNRGVLSPGGSQIHSNLPLGSDCVDDGPEAIGCQSVLLLDGFEFGDTLAWSSGRP